MAKSGTTKDRAGLEARRARLEATLGADANWRALRLCHAQSDDKQGEERHARDARLELLLLANPTFRAWKQVDDAIEALDKTESKVNPQPPRGLGLSLPPLPLTSSNSPKEVVSLADLSQGIARLIQRASPDGGYDRRSPTAAGETEEGPSPSAHEVDEPATVAAEVSPETDPEVAVEVAAEAEPDAAAESLAEAEVIGAAEPEAEADAEAEIEHEPGVIAAGEPAEPMETAAAPHTAPPVSEPKKKKLQNESPADRPWMVVRERARDDVPLDDGAGDDSDDSDDDSGTEVEEASVTFVARDLPASRGATASSPGYDSIKREDAEEEGEDAEEISYPLGADIEEAEVTILKARQIEERRQTAQRDGNLRRFRRALLGD